MLLYDPEDRHLQRFFQGHRYPDEEDLVNAHHTLRLATDKAVSPTLAEIGAISPLPKARLKVCLDLFADRGIVMVERGGAYRFRAPDLTRAELAAAGASYRERHERDQLKQQQVREYAEGHGCRWQVLLRYFGGEGLPEGRCGHCDRCVPVASQAAALTAASQTPS